MDLENFFVKDQYYFTKYVNLFIKSSELTNNICLKRKAGENYFCLGHPVTSAFHRS